MARYGRVEILSLERELAYTPAEHRRTLLSRMEALIPRLVPDRLYTYDYAYEAVTGFRPEEHGEALLSGEELHRGLGRMLTELSRDACLVQTDDDAPIPLLEASRSARVRPATVRRWGRRGLPLAYYHRADGGRLLCARRRFLDDYLRKLQARTGRTAGKVTDEERRAILDRAKVLAANPDSSPSDVVRRLAKESGRCATTVRRILRDAETADERAALRRRGASRRLIERYRQGISVAALAKEFGRTRSAVYRVLHHALVEEALARKIKYVPSPEFTGKDAATLCLGDEGLFTYPPEPTDDMPKAPDSLPAYLRELYSIPLLDRADEQALFRKYNYVKHCAAAVQERIREKGYRLKLLERFGELRQASDALRRILVRCNLRLVVSIAKRHVGPLAPLFDLVSEGNMCLMRAVECFDYTRNVRFATYATWAISKHFARVVPEENYRLATFVTGQERMLATADDAQTAETDRREALAHIRTVIRQAAQQLTEREREIIASHFGADGRPEKTLAEIGKRFGLTRERIRQIEARALGKLRRLIAPEAIEALY